MIHSAFVFLIVRRDTTPLCEAGHVIAAPAVITLRKSPIAKSILVLFLNLETLSHKKSEIPVTRPIRSPGGKNADMLLLLSFDVLPELYYPDRTW
jgi:hypothetical protein